MIQRIQTVWLLLAMLINAVLFRIDLYTAHIIQNGTDTITAVNVTNYYPLLIIAALITLLPLFAIFLFKNRKQQKGIVTLSIVVTLGFIALTIMRVGNLNNATPPATGGAYSVLSVLPVVSLIFLFLALKGIRKDEKLVKSLDRLR